MQARGRSELFCVCGNRISADCKLVEESLSKSALNLRSISRAILMLASHFCIFSPINRQMLRWHGARTFLLSSSLFSQYIFHKEGFGALVLLSWLCVIDNKFKREYRKTTHWLNYLFVNLTHCSLELAKSSTSYILWRKNLPTKTCTKAKNSHRAEQLNNKQIMWAPSLPAEINSNFRVTRHPRRRNPNFDVIKYYSYSIQIHTHREHKNAWNKNSQKYSAPKHKTMWKKYTEEEEAAKIIIRVSLESWGFWYSLSHFIASFLYFFIVVDA